MSTIADGSLSGGANAGLITGRFYVIGTDLIVLNPAAHPRAQDTPK